MQKISIICQKYFLYVGTMQNKVSIHDILEKAKVMLGNSRTRDIQDTDSDTGEKLQGV